MTKSELRLGERSPKHTHHSIICIGALIAHKENEHWVVDAIDAPHVGERSERDLSAAFVEKIAQLKPQLVSFNGASFDLPVLRYRAMVHKVPANWQRAPTFIAIPVMLSIFVLSSFAPGAKAGLHELCRVMGLPGKPDAINEAEVDRYFRENRIREIAEHCERCGQHLPCVATA